MISVLKDVIGRTKLHHAAWPVPIGMLDQAVAFFVDQLGWIENKEAKVSGDWGTARFVKPTAEDKFMIQLTEYNEVKMPDPLNGTHLAISVEHARSAASAIVEWGISHRNIASWMMPANSEETKWFVTLSGLLGFELELVTIPQESVAHHPV